MILSRLKSFLSRSIQITSNIWYHNSSAQLDYLINQLQNQLCLAPESSTEHVDYFIEQLRNKLNIALEPREVYTTNALHEKCGTKVVIESHEEPPKPRFDWCFKPREYLWAISDTVVSPELLLSFQYQEGDFEAASRELLKL